MHRIHRSCCIFCALRLENTDFYSSSSATITPDSIPTGSTTFCRCVSCCRSASKKYSHRLFCRDKISSIVSRLSAPKIWPIPQNTSHCSRLMFQFIYTASDTLRSFPRRLPASDVLRPFSRWLPASDTLRPFSRWLLASDTHRPFSRWLPVSTSVCTCAPDCLAPTSVITASHAASPVSH